MTTSKPIVLALFAIFICGCGEQAPSALLADTPREDSKMRIGSVARWQTNDGTMVEEVLASGSGDIEERLVGFEPGSGK